MAVVRPCASWFHAGPRDRPAAGQPDHGRGAGHGSGALRAAPLRRGAGGASVLAGARFGAGAPPWPACPAPARFCDQPRQASVIDTPAQRLAAVRSRRPSSRWLSIITPVMRARRRRPAARPRPARDLDLAQVRLVGIGVREVDHDLLALAGLAQHRATGVHAGRVVGPLRRADHVRVLVAAGFEDGGHAHLGHAHEGVLGAGGDHRVGGDLHAAVGAVLKPSGQLRPELSWRWLGRWCARRWRPRRSGRRCTAG